MSNRLDPDQARQNIKSDLVQSVCKSYEQTTLVGKELLFEPLRESGDQDQTADYKAFKLFVINFEYNDLI